MVGYQHFHDFWSVLLEKKTLYMQDSKDSDGILKSDGSRQSPIGNPEVPWVVPRFDGSWGDCWSPVVISRFVEVMNLFIGSN